MPWRDLPEFWRTLPGDDEAIQSIQALKLLILTATRTSEVIEADWREIDLGNATWVIPAERTQAACRRLYSPRL